MGQSEEFRLIVCGGRNFDNKAFVWQTLRRVHQKRRIDLLMEGGQVTKHPEKGVIGADTFAWEWAVTWGVPVQTFHADWDNFGRAAGPIRNKQMLEEGRANGCLGFAGGRGTSNMLNLAHQAGITIMTPGWNWSPAMQAPAQDKPLIELQRSAQAAIPELAFG